MPLLSKFITYQPTKMARPVASESQDPHIQHIISNLKTVLQCRSTFANSQKIGLKDYSEQVVGEALMHQLCTDMREQIDLHEPRLNNVKVSLAEQSQYSWYLQVNATLSNSKKTLSEAEQPKQVVSFILELTKPAYISQLREVKVVML